MKRLKLQLFAEGSAENSGADNAENNNPNAEGNGGNSSASGNKQTYTQEDLDKIVTERTGRAEKSALKSFFQQQGLTEEEANAAIADYKKSKADKAEASKNDAKAQSERADQAEKRAQEATERANAMVIKASAHIQASSLGVKSNKLDYVVKMADLSKVTVDEHGTPDEVAVKAAIEQVLKDIPEFKESKDSSGFKIGADGNKETNNENDIMRAAFGLPSKKK